MPEKPIHMQILCITIPPCPRNSCEPPFPRIPDCPCHAPYFLRRGPSIKNHGQRCHGSKQISPRIREGETKKKRSKLVFCASVQRRKKSFAFSDPSPFISSSSSARDRKRRGKSLNGTTHFKVFPTSSIEWLYVDTPFVLLFRSLLSI